VDQAGVDRSAGGGSTRLVLPSAIRWVAPRSRHRAHGTALTAGAERARSGGWHRAHGTGRRIVTRLFLTATALIGLARALSPTPASIQTANGPAEIARCCFGCWRPAPGGIRYVRDESETLLAMMPTDSRHRGRPFDLGGQRARAVGQELGNVPSALTAQATVELPAGTKSPLRRRVR
jgi:hypothetical protein